MPSDATIESKGFNLVVHKVIQAGPPLPSGIAAAVATFWEARRVRFSEKTEARMVGRRGSMWWNAATFDMSKLRTDVTVTMDAAAGSVTCTLRVNTFLQTISDMNRRYWIEEMKAFESSILRNDDRAAEWQEFKRGYNKSSLRWVIAVAVVVFIARAGRDIFDPLVSWLAGVFR